jgi:UPF0716 protein FxsA
MRVFFLLFILFPIIELALLIKVGGLIGVLPTLLLLVGGALLGAVLLRIAGVATAWRARERLARGELPEKEMLEGLMIALGGGLLVLPGFLSDILGLLFILPFSRRLLLRALGRRIEARMRRQRAFSDDPASAEARPQAQRPDAARPNAARPNVIEGEYERRDE